MMSKMIQALDEQGAPTQTCGSSSAAPGFVCLMEKADLIPDISKGILLNRHSLCKPSSPTKILESIYSHGDPRESLLLLS